MLHESLRWRGLILLPTGLLVLLCFHPAGPAIAAQITADGWFLTSDIECGNAETIERIDKNRFLVCPREDAVPIEVQVTGPISSYVISFEIRNAGPTRRDIEIDVKIPQWMITNPKRRFDYFLRKPYLLRSPKSLEWSEVEPANQTDLEDRVRLRISLASGERKILSTIPFFPYSALRERMGNIAKQAVGDARIKEIGKSIEGRPILALEFGDQSLPRLAFLATTQPGEPAAWGVLAMAESAVKDPEIAKLRRKFSLCFIPMTNPDGVVGGRANVNSREEMLFLGFEAAAKNEQAYAEARVLWDYLRANPPIVLIDFHFLSLPNHKIPRPYVIDRSLFTDSRRRQLSEDLAERLVKLSGAVSGQHIGAGDPMWIGLLTYQSICQWNTVSFLYQNTGPTTSYRQSQTRGVQILKASLEAVCAAF